MTETAGSGPAGRGSGAPGRARRRLVALPLSAALLVAAPADAPRASSEVTAMPANALIQWHKEGGGLGAPAARDVPDVTVFADGRLRLGPRLGGGEVAWHRLPPDRLEELRRFVFDEQAVTAIDAGELARDVEAAAARREAADASAVALSPAPQMDAGTTIIRVADDGREHEVRYHDLFGDAQRYPEVEGLQRLRAVELRLLRLAEEHAAGGP